MSSAYHHQTIGKVERFHKFMENSLSTVVSKDQKNWANLVDRCLFVCRTTFNRGLNELPFYLMYGRDPVNPQDLLVPGTRTGWRSCKEQDLDVYNRGRERKRFA